MSRAVFDLFQPKVDESEFTSGKMKCNDFYGDTEEYLLPGMLQKMVKSPHMSCFVDSNHAGNAVTRSLHKGILIYVTNAPIIWFSKKQNNVESSTFGSEFTAMRIPRDLILALH